MGGLFSASLLRIVGWDVTVFERTSNDLSDRGAGIGTRDELFAVLRLAGVSVDASIGVEVRSRLCYDSSGVLVHEVPLRSISSSWARVYQPLRAALPSEYYRSGAVLERIEQDAKHANQQPQSEARTTWPGKTRNRKSRRRRRQQRRHQRGAHTKVDRSESNIVPNSPFST